MLAQIKATYDGSLTTLIDAIQGALGQLPRATNDRVELEVSVAGRDDIDLQACTLDEDTLAFRLWVDHRPGQWKVGTLLDGVQELANHPKLLQAEAAQEAAL